MRGLEGVTLTAQTNLKHHEDKEKFDEAEASYDDADLDIDHIQVRHESEDLFFFIKEGLNSAVS